MKFLLAWKFQEFVLNMENQKSEIACIPHRRRKKTTREEFPSIEGGKCLIKALKILFIPRNDTVRVFIRLHDDDTVQVLLLSLAFNSFFSFFCPVARPKRKEQSNNKKKKEEKKHRWMKQKHK